MQEQRNKKEKKHSLFSVRESERSRANAAFFSQNTNTQKRRDEHTPNISEGSVPRERQYMAQLKEAYMICTTVQLD